MYFNNPEFLWVTLVVHNFITTHATQHYFYTNTALFLHQQEGALFWKVTVGFKKLLKLTTYFSFPFFFFFWGGGSFFAVTLNDLPHKNPFIWCTYFIWASNHIQYTVKTIHSCWFLLKLMCHVMHKNKSYCFIMH